MNEKYSNEDNELLLKKLRSNIVAKYDQHLVNTPAQLLNYWWLLLFKFLSRALHIKSSFQYFCWRHKLQPKSLMEHLCEYIHGVEWSSINYISYEINVSLSVKCLRAATEDASKHFFYFCFCHTLAKHKILTKHRHWELFSVSLN